MCSGRSRGLAVLLCDLAAPVVFPACRQDPHTKARCMPPTAPWLRLASARPQALIADRGSLLSAPRRPASRKTPASAVSDGDSARAGVSKRFPRQPWARRLQGPEQDQRVIASPPSSARSRQIQATACPAQYIRWATRRLGWLPSLDRVSDGRGKSPASCSGGAAPHHSCCSKDALGPEMGPLEHPADADSVLLVAPKRLRQWPLTEARAGRSCAFTRSAERSEVRLRREADLPHPLCSRSSPSARNLSPARGLCRLGAFLARSGG
jgi:hypothetical protein